ncbi:thioredoxin family protein [Hyalangium versicolor]|uniref:thioredoxin family protein n=1 Tax=Hyalangium versicolor TaxID=2861190 RepID=UPI001CCD503D|nr:thioredoxin family protein [Hyalangium versicolor]
MRTHVACLFVVGLLACTASRTGSSDALDDAHEGAPLPFIDDDYARALSEAKAKGVPLFVDTWAPWCHTCRSMKAYVFTDKALARHAGRFVWLEINTDLPSNAAFQEKYPVEFWPTFFIIDPKEEKPLVRFAGSATVAQLEKIFEDGERAYRGDAQGAEAALARGDALYGANKPAEAAEAFSQALSQAPHDWSRRGRTVESLLVAFWGAKQFEPCARKAIEELPRVPRSPSLANAVTMAIGCASSLPGENPQRKELLNALDAKGREALAPPLIDMPADDRSGLYEAMVDARSELGDKAGSKALATEWLTFLEGEAAKAPNPDARSVFDSHRMLAAMILEDPMRAVPAIEQSEKDLPNDYNPPARLANLYRALGRLDDALAANARALTKVQGSRKLRVFADRATIQAARGEKDAAVKTMEEAISYAKTLSEAQVSKRQIESLDKKLAELKAK